MKLYMAITADKFELPLLIEDNIDDFARKLGLTKNTVWCEICRDKGGKRKGYRIVRIEVDPNDEE